MLFSHELTRINTNNELSYELRVTSYEFKVQSANSQAKNNRKDAKNAKKSRESLVTFDQLLTTDNRQPASNN